MNKVPFRVVLLHALVVDENGEKMSKVRGNVLDPLHLVHGADIETVLGVDKSKPTAQKDLQEAFSKFKKAFPSAASAYGQGFPKQGADALRFFLLVMGAQGRNIRLSVPRVEGYRHFLNKIWSAVRFFLMHAEEGDTEGLQGFRNALLASRGAIDDELSIPLTPIELSLADRYILSRLQRITDEVDQAWSEYRFADGAQALYHFFWNELCDWYIEMCKPHLGESADPKRRRAALGTLQLALETSLRLLHPIIPFITEELWLKLPRFPGAPASCMITLYPSADDALKDADAERDMAMVQSAVSAIRTLKSQYQLKSDGNVEFVLKSSEAGTRAVLTAERGLIEQLTRCRVTDVVGEYENTRGTIPQVQPGLTALLLNAAALLDIPAELVRLGKEAQKAEKERDSLRGRLANPDFVVRAKPEVVAENRARISELEARLAEIESHTTTLKAMSAA